MFSLVSGIYDNYFAPSQLNLLVVGAPGVGKTTLLERLKVTEFSKRPKVPTSSNNNNSNNNSSQFLTPLVQPIPPKIVLSFHNGGAILDKEIIEVSKNIIKQQQNENKKTQQQQEEEATTITTTSSAAAATTTTAAPTSTGTATTTTSNISNSNSTTNNNNNNTNTRSVVAPLSPVIVKQKQRRFLPLVCPAPERYKKAAVTADQDEDFVFDDEDNNDNDNDTDNNTSKEKDALLKQQTQQQTNQQQSFHSNDDEQMENIPLDPPTSPQAPTRVRLHSKEMSVSSIDIMDNDDDNDNNNNTSSKPKQQQQQQQQKQQNTTTTTTNGTTPKKHNSKNKQQQQQQRQRKNSVTNNTTTALGPNIPLQQQSDEEYDVKPNAKMLALKKIRPTIGTNLAKVEMCGAKCHFFDVGGRLQDLWERYYDDCDAVIFCWKLDNDNENDNNNNRNNNNDNDSDDDNDNDNDNDDNDSNNQFDMKKQQELLNIVRKSIPDDIPFLIFGHIYDNVNNNIVNTMYSTNIILPHYHNPMTGLCFGSAKTGSGIRYAMEWLIPLTKRQQKERLSNNNSNSNITTTNVKQI